MRNTACGRAKTSLRITEGEQKGACQGLASVPRIAALRYFQKEERHHCAAIRRHRCARLRLQREEKSERRFRRKHQSTKVLLSFLVESSRERSRNNSLWRIIAYASRMQLLYRARWDRVNSLAKSWRRILHRDHCDFVSLATQLLHMFQEIYMFHYVVAILSRKLHKLLNKCRHICIIGRMWKHKI